MKQGQLIPKNRRKRQPTADTMREQLRLAADEIISLRTRLWAAMDPDAPYRVVTLRRMDSVQLLPPQPPLAPPPPPRPSLLSRLRTFLRSKR